MRMREEKRILGSILRFSRARKIKLYIVGGFLRDMLLGRKVTNTDIDFAVKKNAIKFSADLAGRLAAGFVVLDRACGCARLVKKRGDGVYTLDFTDFRGRDLLQDLARRDFTINALAVELKAFLTALDRQGRCRLSLLSDCLIDPYQGRRDLCRGVIRVLDARAFDDDPLRILRAFSFSSMLNFRIEPRTLSSLRKKRIKLKRVSSERIRDELFKILANPGSDAFLRLLDRYRLLELIIPQIKAMHRLNQGPYHHLDVWRHTLETVAQLERIIKSYGRRQDIRDYLNEEITSGRNRLALIKLGALMHDIGKPQTLRIEEGKVMFHGHERVGSDIFEKVAKRLRLSNEETGMLKKIIRFHLRPGYLADNPVLTRRGRFRFFRDAASEAVSVLLISLADQRATRGHLTTRQSRMRQERVVRRLIREYFQKKTEKKIVRLINGNDLIKRFKLKPSPLIGRILSQAEEAQAIGRIKNKREALKLAESIMKGEGR
ncbi:HD domain-containing protein [Candidatus Omnitrophota bacterium]